MTREEIIAMNGGKSPEWKLGYAKSALELCLRIAHEEPGVPMLAKRRIENIVKLAFEVIK